MLKAMLLNCHATCNDTRNAKLLIAMFKAWPKGNSVGFEFVYAPIRIDEPWNPASQPVMQRPPEEW